MAGRVNTKFVIGLLAVLVAMTVAPFGYWYFFVRADAAALTAQGDELMSQGLVDQALTKYGKAIKAGANDVESLLRYVGAIEQVRTSDPRVARNYLGQMVGNLRQAISKDPHAPVPFEKLMAIYLKLSRELGDSESWNRMYEEADARLMRQSGTDNTENEVLAKKFRGIAGVNRMQRINLTQEQRDRPREDLVFVLEQTPDDRDTIFYLAAWHVLESRAVERSGGDEDRVQQYREEADRLSAESLRAHAGDPHRQMDRVRVLSLIKRNDRSEVRELLDQVEAKVLADPSESRLVIELIEILPGVDTQKVSADQSGRPIRAGLKRSEKVLRAAVDAVGDDPRMIVALGRVLEIQGRFDEAQPLYRRAYELEPSVDVFEGLQLDQLRASATIKYTNLLLRQVAKAPSSERKTLLEEAQGLVDGVVTNHGESAEVNLVLGKIAMARGQWGPASNKLDRANAQFQGTKPEALLLSAKAWVQMGELGAATDRLERLIQIRPSYTPARRELIRLYVNLDNLAKAQSHLDQLALNDPDDIEAVQYKADILAKSGQTQQAIDLYLSLDPQQHPELIHRLAALYVTVGQLDAAREILQQRFNEAPSDVGVLQELVRVSRDTQEAMGHIKTARAAGADPQALEILESKFEGKANLEQVLEGLIDNDEVPFRRHIKRYRLYRRLGRSNEADQELDLAAQLRPDHAMVVAALFDRALHDHRWDEAEELASRAGDLNIDLAEGMFYYGRLEHVRGQHDRAIARYRRGLSIRKIYSEGWRWLGDAQRDISNWHEAAESYRQALEQRPNNVNALRGLAMVLNASGESGQALDALRKAVRFAPGQTALREQYLSYEYRYGNKERVLRYRQRIADSQPRDVVNLRAFAVLLAQNGQAGKAQSIIDGLMEDFGSDRSNIQAAAVVHSIVSNPESAVTLVHDYVKGLGDQAGEDDWLMLARFLLRVGQTDQAMAAFRQGISVEQPDKRRVTREFSDYLFNRGEYAKAVNRYQQLWESFPNDKRIGQRYTEALLRVNDIDLAKQVLGKLTEQHGVDGSMYVLEAMVARSSGDLVAARAALDRAVELDPNRPVVYYQRAELLVSDPDQEAVVVEDLTKALSIDPGMDAARRLLATVYLRRGQRDEAIQELGILLRNNPQHIGARLQLANLYGDGERWVERRALLEESARRFPRAVIWPQLQAQQAMIDGKEKEARRKLEKAFEMAPSPQTLGELASLLIRMDQADAALALLRSQGEIVRPVPLLHALRGRSLAVLKDDDLARRAFARAVEQCKTFQQAVAVGSQMVRSVGLEETVSQLEQLSRGPQAELLELTIAQLQIESENYDAVSVRLKRVDRSVAEESPLRTDFNRLLALVLYKQGFHEQALTVYQSLLKVQPNNLVTLNNTAYLLAEDLDRAEDAVPLAQRAADLAPENPLVLDTLGWSMHKTGRSDDAVKVLRRSVRIKPSALNCLHLADVLDSRGDRVGAVEYFEKAKELAEMNNDEQSLWLAGKRLDELTQNVGVR